MPLMATQWLSKARWHHRIITLNTSMAQYNHRHTKVWRYRALSQDLEVPRPSDINIKQTKVYFSPRVIRDWLQQWKEVVRIPLSRDLWVLLYMVLYRKRLMDTWRRNSWVSPSTKKIYLQERVYWNLKTFREVVHPSSINLCQRPDRPRSEDSNFPGHSLKVPVQSIMAKCPIYLDRHL